MLNLIRRLLKFNIPRVINTATPTLRQASNDPNQPRVRTSGIEVRPRKPVPPN